MSVRGFNILMRNFGEDFAVDFAEAFEEADFKTLDTIAKKAGHELKDILKMIPKRDKKNIL